MTMILDLGKGPVCGRVHAVNRKHRLRTKHHAEIKDWPESGASVDVIDADALDAMDFYPNRDQMFLVSAKLLGVIRTLAPKVDSHELDAGGRTVHLVMPLEGMGIMPDFEEFPEFSKSGYNIVSGTNLRVSQSPDGPFCVVTNSGLLAVSDELAAAASDAGIRWDLAEVIEDYQPFRPHPYVVYQTGYAAAVATELVATEDWPAVPDHVAHPLGEDARDVKFDGDADEAWTKHAAKTEHVARCAFVRYCSGLELPAFAAQLDDCAKSKRKKRWKETLAAGCLSLHGLPCVSEATRDKLLAAGVEASFDPVVVSETALEETVDFYLVTPTRVVDWIDWSCSDVGLLWSGVHDRYYDLEPTEESYSSKIPLVRVAGSNLILIHESIAPMLTKGEGFHLTPLHERAVGRNLDDCIRAT